MIYLITYIFETKQYIICAYAKKEKAMANLIMALKIPPVKYCPGRLYNPQCCKSRQNNRMYY
ncbi:hypothetical protein [Clostridium beijerinckii]|uniref:hypothetical protein n=1 Tax=Clostridium beijerinckii TaxID=1520 RepID=UPI001361CA17|nr:hypothetical protein [Clostridium beijerinckii]MZK76858.1 hypothetical protein [Clostridium beijerinckii]MZL01004.1 hypothetical protein [Clostridium beijerinckii]MZL29113.1 hypothetical protein [Clostridium beijerinckii]